MLQPDENSKRKILFVDDEDQVIRWVSRVLVPLGYEILPAESAFHAFEILKANFGIIKCVVTDHKMKGPKSLEVVNYCAEKYPWIGRVIFSGGVPPEIEAASIRGNPPYMLVIKTHDGLWKLVKAIETEIDRREKEDGGRRP